MRTLRISVRRLVEFLLRSGDIDSGSDWRNSVEAMQAGSSIHRTLQAAAGNSYQAEVSLACSVFYPENTFSPHAARLDIREEAVRDQKGFFLCIEGRADGIIDDGAHPITIDEIKGVTRDVSAIEEPVAIHEAQALCYAYLYLRRKRGAAPLSSAFGEHVVVRLTYASMTTGEVRQIERPYRVPDVEARFFALLDAAQRWAAWRIEHDGQRGTSLASLVFPLEPRDAQREIMAAVSSAIHKGKRLYVQAPTGSGKTIATLYPALKALGSGKVSHVAFLTAKTTTRRAALECLYLLRRQNINANALIVTARDKICPLRKAAHGAELRSHPLASLCNPVECPLARGHHDRANDALWEAITTCDVLNSFHIEQVAAHHHVCPYELQRDLARWADVIVCDYHYAFAPSAALLGLADDPDSGETVFLVDEAHNLVERMRDMYSAELTVAELKGLERLLRTDSSFSGLAKDVHTLIAAFPTGDITPSSTRERGKLPSYQVTRIGDAFEDSLAALPDGINNALERFFPTTGDWYGDARNERNIEIFLTLRDMDLKIRAFLGTLQRAKAGYVTFLGRAENGGRRLKVYCVDPSHDLDERLAQARTAVFFSGTLLPMDYHRKLLAAREDDVSLYAQSVFNPSHQQVLIGSDISARFSQRGPELYIRCSSYLVALVHARPGNYLAFFPSYALLEEVAKALVPLMGREATVLRQHPSMSEGERERFVARFYETREEGTSLIGLCVLGGIFGESIDLPGETLVGVVVVGTGMPRATAEREVIRDHFDTEEGSGFAYAYTYPGMIKVLQAAGRLIRTEEDCGVLLLLDDRFLEGELQEAFPTEWKYVQTCTLETLPSLLA